MTFELGINHDGIAYFAKLTCAAFIASVLAALALLIRPSDVDPWLGLPVGGLFAAVASEWVASESLPDRSGFTLADWVHVAWFLVIYLVALGNVISLRACESGREETSPRINRLAFWTVLLAHAASCVQIVWLR